ncbi:hypothetical protein [Nitrosopumilus sp.]|uniref:hypothetical protein n=1 Tax=Nitrosopumilus sp. TaxID=2024843 RepID=UPI003B597597
MYYNHVIRLVAISIITISLGIQSSFALTESVDLFGTINSADLVLNDIWIEPENPKNREAVTVHGTVYNAGIIPTEAVSNVVTIGYIVNGELVEISLLENVLPGIENGVKISSGPIFDAISGNYVITVILNYHDTLSHLRDNPGNNIVQKVFQIGEKAPLLISSNVYQKYNDRTNEQEIRVEGEIADIFQEVQKNKDLRIKIEDTIRGKVITDTHGRFTFDTTIPFDDRIIEMQTNLENESSISDSKPIFPIKLQDKQSALALEVISDELELNLDRSDITAVIFQDSYENLFGKITTNKNYNRQDTTMNNFDLSIGNFLINKMPSDHEYIVEIYMKGRIVDAFQRVFQENEVITRSVSISETAKVQFKITDKNGTPQDNVVIENWIYSASTNSEGLTEWINTLPNFTSNEPYVAKAIFPDGTIVWSEPFVVNEQESVSVEIIMEAN